MPEPRQMFARKLYRRFETLDFMLRSCVRRIATLFMHNEGAGFLREILEPAASGVAMGLALLLLDEVRQRVGAPELFKHAIDSAVEHAKPYAFFLSVLFVGGYMASVGSLLSTLVRRLVVLPLARLSTHATMFALGVFWVLAGLELWAHPRGVALGAAFQVTVALGALGACSRALVLFFESGLADRIGVKYQSARLICLVLGAVLLFVAVRGLEQLNAQDARAAKEAPQRPSSTGH